MIPCLIFLVRGKVLAEDILQLIGNRSFIFLSGYIALIIGLITVILHNVWVSDWRVVITILGWIALIKGVVRIGFPEATKKLVPKFRDKPLLARVWLVIAIFVGAWLIWMSY